MRRGAAAALIATALLSGAAAAQDADDAPVPAAPPATASPALPPTLPESLGEAVGLWDLSLEGTNRRCALTLSGENGANGRIVRFPAGCRRALPLLAGVAGWLFADGGVRLVDRDIRPVLLFTARPDKRSLTAQVEGGSTYNFVPLQTAMMLPQPAAPAPETERPATALLPGAQPVLPDALVPAAADPVPGTYALDRFAEKDVCRIELAPRPASARSEHDVAPVRLLPDCRDNGITVFDPTAWRFANGHMTLKSRRGHAVNLVETGPGQWRRDPDIGTTFVLRKVVP